jgi:hypothetical protein
MHRLLLACLLATPILAHAQSWSPTDCGAEPTQPRYDLTSRPAYNDAVKQANAYQQAARDYSACVLKQAHADQTVISRQAQNRIADIQAIAVAKQQDIYSRLAAQSASFKSAAARLKSK